MGTSPPVRSPAARGHEAHPHSFLSALANRVILDLRLSWFFRRRGTEDCAGFLHRRKRVSEMSRATPQMLNFAKRLVTYETLANKSSQTKTPMAFHVGDRLRPQLAALVGNGGYRALLLRALALTKAEVPWLRAVQVNMDGSLEGSEELHVQLAPDKFFDCSVVLLAQLLGILVAFIGETLTLHLVREVWPKVPVNDLGFGKGGTSEKTG